MARIPTKKTIYPPQITDDVLESFGTEWNKGEKKRFILFERVGEGDGEGEQQIVITKVGPWKSTFNDFVSAFPREAYSLGVLNFTFRVEGGGRREKQVCIASVPETLGVQERMVGKMTLGLLSKALNEISTSQFQMEISDMDDLDVELVMAKTSKFELDPIDRSVEVCID